MGLNEIRCGSRTILKCTLILISSVFLWKTDAEGNESSGSMIQVSNSGLYAKLETEQRHTQTLII